MNSRLVGLLGVIALGVGPAVGQPEASGRPVRLDPPDVDLVDQTGAPHRFVHDLVAGKIAVVSFVTWEMGLDRGASLWPAPP